MEDNIKKLKTEFYKIQCKNWIENTEKGTSAAGKILENLLLFILLPHSNYIERLNNFSKSYLE